ncbi:MAG: Gfo/Idh/MocA family oxidoreductase [Rhodothermales bacterium]|nr:Gfo/Idh/MocA family oxidoreductase [Rhodothermales bacterium]
MDKPDPQIRRESGVTRRDFLKTGAFSVGVGMAAGPLAACKTPGPGRPQVRVLHTPDIGPAPQQLLAAPPMETVRIGFVGVGGQGTSHVRNLLRIAGVEIRAICDIVDDHALHSQKLVVDAGFAAPTLYTRGERDFERMCAEEDLDLVFNATPWKWHVPVCIAAMTNGKHAATEVPAATTVEGCWELVEAAEKHRLHCVMMENCNYGRSELMVFNMVRQGLLGEVLHAECGYLHDLRAIKFAPEGEGLWRRDHSRSRNGNLYPTHGLGPVAQCMDINRGDRFDHLVSMSSPSRGLQLYAQDHYPEESPMRSEKFVLGDVNVSLIKTARGRTIFLSHDTNLPRPYSRINMVQGTRGLFQGYPDRVYIEGRSPSHQWEPADNYRSEFDHPLWQQLEEESKGAGHGGMDFLEDYRLISCLRNGLPTDMNVYDAATISAVCELTEVSVANGSAPISFPDFTRGRWETWPEVDLQSS